MWGVFVMRFAVVLGCCVGEYCFGGSSLASRCVDWLVGGFFV